MRESFLFEAMEKYRNRLLKQVSESCPQDKRDTVPAGFKNNIHWHLGHILTVTDGLVYGFMKQEKRLPAAYQTFFGNGTKPADWTEEVPSWDTVITKLGEQIGQIRADFAGKMDDEAAQNFFNAATAEEVLVSSMIHESGHAGNINAMLKLLV